MENISKIISGQSRLKRFQKPLEAANICQAAATCANGRYGIVSFKNGLLTVSTESNAAAANLQMEQGEIIAAINQKLGKESVKKIRFKIA